ncbi:MAG: cation:proton antiporter [Thermoplasmata archaeon]|nr:cation:proton antiporter [Thermoplasmata archaeon]
MSLEFDLVLVLGAVVGTALVARWTRLPITALEIVVGIFLVAVTGFTLPGGTSSLLVLGSLLIVFLAGLETNLAFLRTHLRTAFAIGLPGFLVPLVGLFALLYFGFHAPLLISLIVATALADTSISIVYTTLHQYKLADLPFGRLILATTLSVNLFEDFTVTTTTFLTAPGFLFTLGVLGALAVAALMLPRLSRLVLSRSQPSFSNINTRSLLFSLAVLAALSSLVGVPGILFVFLMGLMFSQFTSPEFITDVRKFAFALFVPLYFVAVGLKVNVNFVLVHWPILLLIVGVATALRIAGIYSPTRFYMGAARAGPVTALMNTRLTSATVILLLTLTLGLITPEWYSIAISSVVILALGSVLVLRSFPAFRTAVRVQALLTASPEAADQGRWRGAAPPSPSRPLPTESR